MKIDKLLTAALVFALAASFAASAIAGDYAGKGTGIRNPSSSAKRSDNLGNSVGGTSSTKSKNALNPIKIPNYSQPKPKPVNDKVARELAETNRLLHTGNASGGSGIGGQHANGRARSKSEKYLSNRPVNEVHNPFGRKPLSKQIDALNHPHRAIGAAGKPARVNLPKYRTTIPAALPPPT